MLILGIETSCDETSASLIEVKNDKIKVLTNIVSSQVEKHAPFGGVVPSLAAREHVKNLPYVLKEALRNHQGNFDMAKIDLIAVTSGPGLISSLLVGTTFVKTLAYKYKKLIVGVNHMEGHIYSNWLKLTGKSPAFPALCLIVSGGHTQLILMTDHGKYKTIGQTVDDAAGEAFDKIARILELGYPGGPAIQVEAEKLETRDKGQGIKLPRPMINSKDYNFSFAGLKTAVLYKVRELTKKYPLEEIRSEIAYEAQEAIVDVLIQKTIRAAKESKIKSIMLSGGVSANKLLRQRLTEAGEKLEIPVFVPNPEYTTDNAAMIAAAGYFAIKNPARPAGGGKLKKEKGWKFVRADANWEIV